MSRPTRVRLVRVAAIVIVLLLSTPPAMGFRAGLRADSPSALVADSRGSPQSVSASIVGGTAPKVPATTDRPGAVGLPVWLNLTSTAGPPPPSRELGGMVYDGNGSDRFLLLFGGEHFNATRSAEQYYNDTWIYSDGRWSNISPARSPSPRYGFSLTYDAYFRDEYVVLFGGRDAAGAVLNDTWTFSAGVWSNITKRGAPPARDMASMTYSPLSGVVVLFGGTGPSASETNDTWWFSGGYWARLLMATVPPPRHGAAFVDSVGNRGTPILFGGEDAGSFLNDTWEYAGTQWILLPTAVAPSPRADAGFTRDTATNFGVLYGGFSATASAQDTWLWYSGNWSDLGNLTGAPPAGTSWNQLAYDVAYNETVYFPANQTCTFALSFPPLRIMPTVGPLSGYLPLNVTLLSLASGGAPPYNFSWRIGTSSVVYDENTSVILSTVGNITIQLTVTDSALEVARQNWTIVVKQGAPLVASAYWTPNPAQVGQVISFTGSATGGRPPYSFSWEFGDGADSTNASAAHAYAALGTYSIRFVARDSLNGSFFLNFTESVVAPVIALGDAVTPLSGPPPLDVTCTANPSGGTAPYDYNWSFDDGSANGTIPNLRHTYVAPGSYVIRLNVRDASGFSNNDSWTVTVSSTPPPLTLVASVAPLSGAAPLVVSGLADPAGGTPPYAYAWSFGVSNADFTSQNASYTYAAAGDFSVHLTVTDGLSATVSRSWAVAVAPPVPGLTVAIAFYPTQPTAGQTATFSATPSGGVPPYSYAWSFGDHATSESRNATHSYASVGEYLLELKVTDQAGDSQTRNATLHVLPAPIFSPIWILEAGAALAIIAAIAVAVWVRKRRDRGRAGPPSVAPAGSVER